MHWLVLIAANPNTERGWIRILLPLCTPDGRTVTGHRRNKSHLG